MTICTQAGIPDGCNSIKLIIQSKWCFSVLLRERALVCVCVSVFV